jgi:hypothetical protein
MGSSFLMTIPTLAGWVADRNSGSQTRHGTPEKAPVSVARTLPILVIPLDNDSIQNSKSRRWVLDRFRDRKREVLTAGRGIFLR